MRLSARNRIDPSEAEEVSDEVVLTWAPCAKHDKSYEVEMWDLGKEFFFFREINFDKKIAFPSLETLYPILAKLLFVHNYFQSISSII